MPSYNVKLKRREEVAEGTSAFFFEKPEGFQFIAGQFLRWTLIDPPESDEEGDSRSLSIASAPHEDDLMIATRMRDTAFKRVLKSMTPGSEITIKGPYGRMTLHEDPSRPAVFLTGGIGITPFRSISLEAARTGLPHRLWLFYSNRRPEDAAFLEELARLEAKNPNYRFIATMSSVGSSVRSAVGGAVGTSSGTSAGGSKETWTGETGRINAAMLARFIDDLKSPVCYIAGPEGLVSAMRKTLDEAGVSEADILVEQFSGY